MTSSRRARPKARNRLAKGGQKGAETTALKEARVDPDAAGA